MQELNAKTLDPLHCGVLDKFNNDKPNPRNAGPNLGFGFLKSTQFTSLDTKEMAKDQKTKKNKTKKAHQ